ncbi:hypothetical protein C8Q80DRAFT_1103758 [Daedaleopsis nitida]|nr:hypothetical protein C8Q80DRAFT_1103758 [Daedaleopsis nitida]
MLSDLPATGTRISHSGSLGTVRYVGSVDGTNGLWLGVEWDDPKRGKHDGVKDGRRYFSCLVPNSGSFIRPTAAISYGVTFLSALTSKYIDLPRGTASLEKVVLGSSGGAIEVEAVGLDKIRNNLARLERLREVSLDNEYVSKADPAGEVTRTCPGIRGLDLSKNLISDWETIAAIAIELQSLKCLRLDDNRFKPPENLHCDITAFRHLEELQLNATLTSWNEFDKLLPYMPNLRSVELGYNRLCVLYPAASSQVARPSHSTLEIVNFDGNELESFVDVSSAVANFPKLHRLILTSNRVEHLRSPPPPPGSLETVSGSTWARGLLGLNHLALAFNRLAAWADIDMLPIWCPNLESLTLTGNPLTTDPSHASYARAFTIAKIPSLKSLDGTTISPRERTDSELLYLSHIAKQPFSSADEKRAAHPQFEALCTKHSVSDAPAVPEAQDTLSSRLINVRIYHVPHAPPASISPDGLTSFLGGSKSEMTLRVLTTMPVRTLRLKLIKSFKVPKARHGTVRLWMVLPDRHFVELDEGYAGRDLGYWGVEDNTQFVLVDE